MGSIDEDIGGGRLAGDGGQFVLNLGAILWRERKGGERESEQHTFTQWKEREEAWCSFIKGVGRSHKAAHAEIELFIDGAMKCAEQNISQRAEACHSLMVTICSCTLMKQFVFVHRQVKVDSNCTQGYAAQAYLVGRLLA